MRRRRQRHAKVPRTAAHPGQPLPPPTDPARARRSPGPPPAIAPNRIADPAPTAIDGRFRLRACLGLGAAGTVYLAHDLSNGSVVALKLVPLPAHLPPQRRDEWRGRMATEAAAAARLRHPGIVALLDAGVSADLAWLALEYVDGSDLSRYIRPRRLLPEPLVLRVGARIARALAHAHRAGVVHRDLKPSNVRIDLARDVVKLGDFGIARLDDLARTRTGALLGTPAYMAPELLRGDPAGPASDTYALGVLLYELLSARRPREATSLGELLRTIDRDPPVDLAARRPDLPEAVAARVREALERAPERRPADLDRYADRLDRAAADAAPLR
jgi:serine/threonine protein kinase